MAQTETIDCTPTWAWAAKVYILALENGTGEGKDSARKEIMRMAELLDKLIEERKQIDNQ